ncbi:hypothetical protein pdam_00020725, partial [Pocillopora damicornis]
MTTTSKGEERGSKTAETSFIKGTSTENLPNFELKRKEEFLQFPMIMARELQRQELIAQKDNNIEELQKSIQEDEQIAD